jgi:hypothetical protein
MNNKLEMLRSVVDIQITRTYKPDLCLGSIDLIFCMSVDLTS